MKTTQKSFVFLLTILASLASILYYSRNTDSIAFLASSNSSWNRVFPPKHSLPIYAAEHAPYVYLSSDESFWPSDVAVHLQHTTPNINFVALAGTRTLLNLNQTSHSAFLSSNDNVETAPPWLTSVSNKPTRSGYSAAPATIIAVEKPNGIVDVFYFYFYSYNQGPTVMDVRFGNHVGDWEHTMVRFLNGVPQYVYLSAHESGTSYTYDGIDKLHGRPVVYSATGSHANYAAPGKHEFELPDGLLYDKTDAGTLWDVTKNFRGYFYDGTSFTGAGGVGAKPGREGVTWLSWLGRWGDETLPSADPRQYSFFEQYHYSSGPTGPLDKNLERVSVCGTANCDIRTSTANVVPSTSSSDAKSKYGSMIPQFVAFKAELVARNASFTI